MGWTRGRLGLPKSSYRIPVCPSYVVPNTLSPEEHETTSPELMTKAARLQTIMHKQIGRLRVPVLGGEMAESRVFRGAGSAG